MMRSFSCFVVTLLFIAKSQLTHAEFGIPNPGIINETPIGDEQGELEQLFADINVLVEQARQDPQTINLVERMKKERAVEIATLKEREPEEILSSLREVLKNMKLVEVLFQNSPDTAVEEMNKEGLIDKKHLEHYQKNPGELETDMRKGLYFQFLSLAVVRDYL